MNKKNTIIASLFLALVTTNCFAGVDGIYVWKSGKAKKELEVKKIDNKTVEFSLTMGEGVIGGCGGMVDTSKAILEKDTAIFTGEDECKIKIKFNNNGAEVAEEGCLYYHGASCDFDGKYKKKK